MNQREVFKKTLDWVQERIDKGILNKTSADLIEEAMGMLRNEVSQYLAKNRKEKDVLNYIKGGYETFYSQTSKEGKITKTSLKDLRPQFKKELENRVQNSINYIKNKDNETKQRLASKLMTWLTVDSKEVRGNTTSKQSLLNFLDFAKENDIAENHAKFILEDQTRKMIANLDLIVASENGAIGGIWRNRKDKRVVGNPNGLYPKGTPSHNDHWTREGVFYVFKDSWAKKRGLVKGEIYENLEDGGVAVAIGCRCRLEMIYDIRDVPKENLTKKGVKFIESAQ